jgi:regulator of protease activity HflC (stomatin/prohibitin superfamily)
MTLIIEDGSIVTGANSYVSAAEYIAWADAREIEYSSTLLESQILRSMDYIESLPFAGQKSTQDQPLQWPRVGVVVDGYDIDHNEIPEQLRKAVYESVKAESEGVSQLLNVERQTARERVGEIEVEYSSSSGSSTSVIAIQRAVKKLINSVFSVSRA